MLNNVQIVIPMCGNGSRFAEKGFLEPKPLIKLNGKPFLYWAAKSALNEFQDYSSLTFVVLQEHVDRFNIISEIQKYFPFANCIVLSHVFNGPVYTCLFAAKQLDVNKPIIFCDCDLAFISNNQPNKFYDAMVFCFKSSLSCYSYAKTDDNGFVVETKEKVVISDNAICGCYCYRKCSDFIDAAELLTNEDNDNEKYMSNIYNYMIKAGKKISVRNVKWQLSFGTPQEYEQACQKVKLLDELK